MKSFFVAGTDTGVGKTWVTCRLLRQLRAGGVNAAGMKPVASGAAMAQAKPVNEDIAAITQAHGDGRWGRFDPALVNQYLYRPAIAPHIAARASGETIDPARIERQYRRLAALADMVIVEGAGGLMTPLNARQTFLDLARLLGLPVLLVVATRLGCVNHALLSQTALATAGVELLGWVANYPAADARCEEDEEIVASLRARLHAPLLGVCPWQWAGRFDLGALEKG